MTQMRRRLQYAWDSNHGKRILTGILLLSYNTAEKLASLSIYDIDAYVITLKADEILNDNNGELEIVARHEEALQSYLKNDDKEYGRTIKRLNSITNKEFVEEAGKIIQNFIGVEAKDEIRATDYRYGYTSYSNDNSKVFVIYMTEDIDTQRLLRTLNSAISESAFLIIVSKWFSAEIVKECIGFNSDFFIVDMASLSVINQHKVEDFEISLKRQQRGYLENIIEDQE